MTEVIDVALTQLPFIVRATGKRSEEARTIPIIYPEALASFQHWFWDVTQASLGNHQANEIISQHLEISFVSMYNSMPMLLDLSLE